MNEKQKVQKQKDTFVRYPTHSIEDRTHEATQANRDDSQSTTSTLSPICTLKFDSACFEVGSEFGIWPHLSPGSTARQLSPTGPRQPPTVPDSPDSPDRCQPTCPTCPDSTLPQKLDSDHACVLSSTVKLSSTLPTARQPDSLTVPDSA